MLEDKKIDEKMIDKIYKEIDCDIKNIKWRNLEGIGYRYGIPLNTIEEIYRAYQMIYIANYRKYDPYKNIWLVDKGHYWFGYLRRYNRIAGILKEELIDLSFEELAKIYKIPLMSMISFHWLLCAILIDLRIIKECKDINYMEEPIIRNHGLQELKNYSLSYIGLRYESTIKDMHDLKYVINNINDEYNLILDYGYESIFDVIMSKISNYFRSKSKCEKIITEDNMHYIINIPLKDLAKIYHMPLLTKNDIYGLIISFYLEMKN